MSTDIYQLFSSNYEESRSRFIEAAQNAGATLDESFHPTESGVNGEPLSQNIALLGNKQASRWFIVFSGTHGGEGYAGAAIQLDWLQRHQQFDLEEVGVAFIHGVNPWGFSYGMRTTEKGIDLNRNFVPQAFRKQEPNGLFDTIAEAMSISKPHPDEFAQFNQKRDDLLKQHGRSAYENALVMGQYHAPEKPIFGGFSEDWANLSLNKLLQKHVTPYAKQVGMIDWHTGLGEHGELFFLNFNNDQPLFDKAYDWWGEPVKELEAGYDGGDKPDYQGTLCHGIISILEQAEVVATVIEVGTYELDKVSDALLVDTWLRTPAGQQAPDREYWREWVLERFCPKDHDWQNKAITQGRMAMDACFNGISNWIKN